MINRKKYILSIVVITAAMLMTTSCGKKQISQESVTAATEMATEPSSGQMEAAVVWEEPVIEKLVREYLGRPDGEILPEDLDFITSIDLYGDTRLFINGKDKDGRTFMDNREQLAVKYYYDAALAGTVTSTADFKNFRKLEDLGIYSSGITEVEQLKHVTGLKRLWLWNNKISSLNGLEALKEVTSLDLSQNDLTDVAPLSTMTNLQELWLWGNPIDDLTPLKDLTNLTTLMIQQTPVLDIGPLSGMTKMRVLDISETAVSDLSPLKDMKELEYLTALFTEVQDWSVLDNMPDVKLKN